MSSRSNNQGRAFEFITLITLNKEISKVCDVVVKKDSSFAATKRAWENIDENIQLKLKNAAEAAIESIFDLEPMILDDGNDKLELSIQPDSQGESGDVRDIVFNRKSIDWEMGLSLKHNHKAVKHSRISNKIDFGDNWYNIPCSDQYWKEVEPIFNYLEKEKNCRVKWSELPDKENDVYIPLLNAFKGELLRSYNSNHEVAPRMFEYLVGKQDFYKIISNDSKKFTEIQTFNSYGTLNKSSENNQPNKLIPKLDLPTQIIDISFKPRSNTTIIISMNEGWKFKFRIHNAATKVETSLKFDINIEESPETLNSIICQWNSF